MSNCGMCNKPEGNPDCVFCKDKIPSVIVKYSELQHRSFNGKRGVSFLPNHASKTYTKRLWLLLLHPRYF